MSLEVIYVTRHGFRSNWLVDPASGSYTAMLRSPTGGAADPALTAHGVEQAKELGERLLTVDPPIERVYSSPYYRCLQTVEPFVRSAASIPPIAPSTATTRGVPNGSGLLIRGETGLGEWYGAATFEHPVPSPRETLEPLFPALLDVDYRPVVVPTRRGEGVDELHDRVASTMSALIAECDRDGVRAILLCSHAAVVIALGRILTGNMPDDIEVEDFKAFTCGVSIYRRRQQGQHTERGEGDGVTRSAADARNPDRQIRCLEWRGRGVSGGWNCELNSDCSHLSEGEERGWRFSGDESFGDTVGHGNMLDAGVQLGVVVEGRRNGRRTAPGGDEGNGGRPKNARGSSRL
ncbi:histidine phosphatase superfamily [Lasiosphaeris hirsuta]|uniref:Histidine phosphatase superfamily n=1 Tax=Lasiosphaeris hirsuta TaxID=260670 RepID=A0AA40A8I8_9PEZI|nr:histidine phosphatase superfamily [Lasiosphaeris hirsuta]